MNYTSSYIVTLQYSCCRSYTGKYHTIELFNERSEIPICTEAFWLKHSNLTSEASFQFVRRGAFWLRGRVIYGILRYCCCIPHNGYNAYRPLPAWLPPPRVSLPSFRIGVPPLLFVFRASLTSIRIISSRYFTLVVYSSRFTQQWG